LKTLDLYIIKKFLGTYFLSIILIVSIAIVFDISEKIDDFINNNAPLKAIVFVVYLNFIPYFANLFSSLFIFISVIFFTSKLAYNTEIIAILSSGISFRRFLLPYILTASFLAGFSFLLNNYIIPSANKKRLDFEETYIRNKYINRSREIHLQIKPNQYFYVQSYNNNSKTGYKFTLEQFKNKRLISKLSAPYIQWDSTINKWTTGPYLIRYINENNETFEQGVSIDTSLNIYPEDFSMRDNVIESMTLGELNQFIRKLQSQGSENVLPFRVYWHQRFAFPFSTFILTIIGVSLSSQKRKGGIGFQIGAGIALSFSYILVMQISTKTTIGNDFNPFLGVWIPNIIYGIIALFLYKTAPK